MLPAIALATATTAGWLAQTLSPAGYEALKRGRLVVVQGEKAQERVQYVHVRALEQLAGLAPVAAELSPAVAAVSSGRPLPASASLLSALSALPPDALMTPELQTAAQSLSALAARLQALGSTQTAAGLVARQPALFDEPWGKRFAAETAADSVDDPAPLVDAFFEEYLAGHDRSADAERHFLDYASRAFGERLGARLSDDEVAGQPSPELRSALERYLREERLLSEAKRLEEGLARLSKSAAFRAQLAAFDAAAAGLKAHPDLLKALESRPFPEQAASPRPTLTSSPLHVRAPVRLAQYELGDTVIVSGAYWVDGLPDGRSVEIDETVFAEEPWGLEALESSRVKRGNGGPYAYERKIALTDSEPPVFESVVSAAGSNALVERAPLDVSRDFETALRKTAAADQAALSCRFKEAGYGQLASELAEPAKQKPQYAELLKTVESRANAAARHAAAFDAAQRLIADSHADASPQACRYDDHRTLKAVEAVRLLPAGCDRYLPELLAQLATIRRRSADQDAFARAAAASRSRRRACEFDAAADKAMEALALLDADPEARCGPLVAEADKLEREAQDARTAAAWRKSFEDGLAAAEQSASADERLRGARLVAARIGASPEEACYDKERRHAELIASAAGEALAPAQNAAPAVDEGLSKAVAAVAAERVRMLQGASAAEKAAASGQTPAAAKASPAAKAPAAANQGATSRLACLEEGYKATEATIDCDGNPFDILELKRLREAQAASNPRKPRIRKKRRAAPASPPKESGDDQSR